MIKKISALLILLLVSIHGFSSTYYGYRGGSVNHNSSGSTLFLVLLGIGALYFFYISIKGWVKRRINGEEPDRPYGTTDWLWALGICAFVSMFACFPIFEILNAYGGKDLVRDTWYIVFLGLFGLLTFSRCT